MRYPLPDLSGLRAWQPDQLARPIDNWPNPAVVILVDQCVPREEITIDQQRLDFFAWLRLTGRLTDDLGAT